MNQVSSIYKSKGVRWIALGWTGFILENLVLSHNRTEIISAFGDNVYHNVYNTLSTIACSSIAWGYFKHGRKAGPKLPFRSKGAIVAGFVAQSVGLVCLSQLAPKLQVPVTFVTDASGTTEAVADPSVSQQTPAPSKEKLRVRCPMDFKAKDAPTDGGVYGIERISRHCVFWSFGLACMGQACYSLFIPEIVMFSFPLAFAVIGTAHQDYRFRRGWGGQLTPEYERITSNTPFAALLTGRQSWSKLFDETKWVNAGLAVTIAGIRFLRVLR